MTPDLTHSQALDVLRYFLGRAYTLDHPTPHAWVVYHRTTLVCVSTSSYTDALARAGAWPDPTIWPPPHTQPYVSIGSNVLRASESIAIARSPNTATRIANALNSHKPNRRGQ